MSYHYKILVLLPLLLAGCNPPKTAYLENPYKNPVVQRGYSHWVMTSNDEWVRAEIEKRRAVRKTGSQIEGYGSFLVDYNGRLHTIEAIKQKEKRDALLAFCKASRSCGNVLDQETKE